MPITIEGSGKIRSISGSDAITVSRVSAEFRNMEGYTSTNPAFRSTDIKRNNPTATTGWYWLNLKGNVGQYWIDMDYDGGGWVCVATHPKDIAIPTVTYANATSYTYSSSSGFNRGVTNPNAYATWVGLTAWDAITSQNGGGNQKHVAYFVSGSQVNLGQVSSHNYRSRWTFRGWSSTYAWVGAANLVNEVGGTTPGFWSYHISNGYSLSTADVDQDAGAGNCAVGNNSPFWYGGCWDGHFWGYNQAGSASQANATHWTGWNNTNNYYNFGAIYVR